MSTAEFHDDDLSDDDEVDDGDAVDLDELTDLDDTAALGSDDTPAAADADSDEDEDEDEPDATADDDESEGEADDDDEESLDVLLAREKVLDQDDLGRIAEESRGGLSVRPALIGADEFTCRSCFLVKRRAQLADEKRLLCFDCV